MNQATYLVIPHKTDMHLRNKYNELFFTVVLFFQYGVSVFNYTLRALIGNTYKIDTLIMYAVLILLCILAFRGVIGSISAKQLLCLAILSVILWVSYLFAPNGEVTFEVTMNIVTVCIPIYIIATSVKNIDRLWSYLEFGSYFAIIAMTYLLYILRIDRYTTTATTYSQSTSYMLLLPCSILALMLFEKFKFMRLFYFLLGFFMMLSCGARGPILCIAIMIIAKTLVKIAKLKNGMRFVFLFGSSMLAIIAIVFSHDFINWLISLFDTLNISTRVLLRFQGSSFWEDRVRNILAENAIASIKEHPLLGLGLINDRFYLYIVTASKEAAIGLYPHNIVLEMYMQFGVIFGTVFLMFLFTFIYKALRHLRNLSKDYNILLIFITVGLIPLMVSGSYVDYSEFYALLGICTAILRLTPHKPSEEMISGVIKERRNV